MEQDFSSIKLLEKVVQLALPIQFISDEFAGVLETLESWKRQYNPQLEGILVNYSNVSLMSRSNKVIISRNGIIIDVKAIFHLFCPKVGDNVKGKVNRISRELVGCIMHDTINATIYLTDYYPDELRRFLRLEREILFEITHFSCYRSEVRVQGKITPDCLKLMSELFPEVEEEELTNLSFQNENRTMHYDFPNDIEECPVFKTEDTPDIPVLDVDESSAALREDQKPDVRQKKSKKRKLEASPSNKPSKKKRKKDTSLSERNEVNGHISLHEIESIFKNELESYDESNLNHLLQSFDKPDEQKQLAVDHPKKKKKLKKEKKHKKGKVVATGTVVKSEKKKLNKKKHSKKDGNKKKDKKSKVKKGHKKEKKKKRSDNLLNSNVQIKPKI